MIVFDKVKYQYHYDEFAIFSNLSFTLRDGVNTILCGEQGGKTSICKLMCAEIFPQSGKITLNGISINAHKDNGVCHLPKAPAFFENKSVWYNIAYPLQVRKVAKAERKAKAEKLASQFELPLDTKVKGLTQAQKAKLAIARALTVERKVVLFDDFFQDVGQMQGVFDLFPNAIKVVLTSRLDLAVGNAIVIDCGECIFEGASDDAKQVASQIVTMIKE